ncbi:MAG TPA: zf-HC2 domain-containing protein [Mycobacteriales bacterium]|nr:zf-HC2 domain-containing protein [Mycobacteriales bacterium]
MNCQTATGALGVYLVGAIEPGERAEVDVHLRGCAACRAELAELAMLPAMLDRLTLDDVAEVIPDSTAPEDLFARVAARARAEADAAAAADQPAGGASVAGVRRRPRWQLMAAAAAAVLVVGGVSVTAVEVLRSAPGPETVNAAQGAVHMRVALTSQATGTALRVTVSGLSNDEHCRLLAIAADGTTDLVSQWDATYAGEAQVTGSTSIATSDLRQLILLGRDGSQLVAADV